MKRLARLILVVSLAVCLPAIMIPATAYAEDIPVYIDFESTGLPQGSSVEGLGTVSPYLNIQSETEDIVLITEGGSILAYSSGGGTNFGMNTWGIGDDNDTGSNMENYVFLFPSGKTVNFFSIMMLDYGDSFPYNGGNGGYQNKQAPYTMTHTAKLVAYGPGDQVLASSVLSFQSIGYNASWRTSLTSWAYGNFWLPTAGDAYPYRTSNISPGRWQFTVEHPGIVKVKLEFEGAQSVDPGIGLDNIFFVIENKPPVAADDSCTTDQDVLLTVSAPGVLGNDNDPDGDAIYACGYDTTSANGGSVAVNEDGSFTYTPPAGFHGMDSFTYEVTDGYAQDTATVSIMVTWVVDIDIKPGGESSRFNNDGKGVIPIVILGSDDLDVTQIDPATLKLEGMPVKTVGKNNKFLAHIQGVNNDGWNDLLVQIQDQDVWFTLGSGLVTLEGNLYPEYGGTYFKGTDSISVEH